MSLIEDLITPEMNKMDKVRGHSQHIYEFLEWMLKENKEVNKKEDIEELIFDFYGVDKAQIAKERKLLRESLERAIEDEEERCSTCSEPEHS